MGLLNKINSDLKNVSELETAIMQKSRLLMELKSEIETLIEKGSFFYSAIELDMDFDGEEFKNRIVGILNEIGKIK